ncbi:MAG: hypothetical protein CM1200mP33_0520 [Chloroflexota bacterium]|nr:MAG: hypothetical protein CM1200mP33_0520 [Chloroflexota bacterium]
MDYSAPLATFSRTNEHGFIETPYRLFKKKQLVVKTPSILGQNDYCRYLYWKKIFYFLKIRKLKGKKLLKKYWNFQNKNFQLHLMFQVIESDIKYLSADLETNYNIAQAIFSY